MEVPANVREENIRTFYDYYGDRAELVHCYDLPQDQILVDPKSCREYVAIDDGKMKKPINVARFGQVNVIRCDRVLTIQGFYVHGKSWHYYAVVSGKARFWVVETKAEEFFLSDRDMSRLVVPPGFWYAFQSLVPNITIVCISSETATQEASDSKFTSHNNFHHLGVNWD